MLKKVQLSIALLIAGLAGAFFAIGGMQVVRAQSGPKLPVAANPGTPQTDFAYFRRAILDNERGADPAAMVRFKAILDAAPVPQTADELSLIASEADAAIGNAHSLVMTPIMRRVPIRVHWLRDGLIIVKTDLAHKDLLGRKVTAIGGRPPEDLLSGMGKLVGGGTPEWVRYRSEYFLTVPSALAVLGATHSADAIVITTVDPAGASGSVALEPDATPVDGNAFREWQQSQPGDESFGTKAWVTLLSAKQELPLYQQSADTHLLLRDLPAQELIYVRICGNFGTSQESAPAFTARVLKAVATRKNLVIDFRYNWGGDYTQFLGLAKKLARALPADGHAYLVTGPNTFSAGLITATQIKYYLGARLTVVGDDLGDTLRFRSEGFWFPLPATHVELYVPTTWDDVGSGCPLFGDCWPPDRFLLKGVGTFAPDIRVANDWASFREARDLVVEAVLADIAKRGPAR